MIEPLIVMIETLIVMIETLIVIIETLIIMIEPLIVMIETLIASYPLKSPNFMDTKGLLPFPQLPAAYRIAQPV